jgi:hypothetical protein
MPDCCPAESCPHPNCEMPVKKYLAPVLVARVYNQPIVEEIPHYAMSMTLDNTANITNAYSDAAPMCEDYYIGGGESCENNNYSY